MKKLGEIIYSSDVKEGPAVGKVESHVPRIEIKKEGEYYEVTVHVEPHPNTSAHSIRWIEVYFFEEGREFNPVSLGRFEFEPEFVEPYIVIKAKLRKGSIYALVYCNLHGLWENRVKIE